MPYYPPPGSSGGGVFGNDYQASYDASESSNSTTNYADKLSFTTPALTGTYRIQVDCITRVTSGTARTLVRLWDNTNSVMLCRWREASAGTNRYASVGGYVTLVFTGNVVNLKLQFCCSTSAQTSYISNAGMNIWRVT